jgi:GDP-L-fucose synthase
MIISDLNSSHVLPAMIRKFQEAKENDNVVVVLWEVVIPCENFYFVDDMAAAVIFYENQLQIICVRVQEKI